MRPTSPPVLRTVPVTMPVLLAAVKAPVEMRPIRPPVLVAPLTVAVEATTSRPPPVNTAVLFPDASA